MKTEKKAIKEGGARTAKEVEKRGIVVQKYKENSKLQKLSETTLKKQRKDKPLQAKHKKHTH